MSKKKEFWVEVGFWLRAFATPFLLFGVSAFVIFFSGEGFASSAIFILVLGTIVGVIYAEHIRRKYGSSNYFTRMDKNPDIRMEKETNTTKGEDKNKSDLK